MNENNFHTRPVVSSQIKNPEFDQRISSPAKSSHRRRFLKLVVGLIIIAMLGFGAFVVIRASDISSRIFVGQKTAFYKKITGLIQGQTGGVKLIWPLSSPINLTPPVCP